ncbi:autotransporter-associated beta strand repeat-containing protein [Amycolatopsis tolypomycina]|uniref:Autotransporter-associated beta strand repeat-containing protein n=1 Tax=Amycolatopsis tolypomycina TaxID=208445 RepID=A0A1H4Z8W7_9PSEU|nr:autotransporter-associated beta strand repeat-containing protein [Amycolatopsis tolypomycina]SED26609.1 autotransporter-associated beta strand repeat-containing protein [Amycolatopsis tolypomycina]
MRTQRGGCRLAVAVVAILVAAPPAPSASAQPGGRDVTADILANRDVTLSGDAVVRLTGGVTAYAGVIRGKGAFTVGGTGTLVLVKDSDFTLPDDRRRQKIVTVGGNHPVSTIENPDPPAVIVQRGATLQYGSGSGGDGSIGHFAQAPGVSLNTLNHRIDGTLDLAVHRQVSLGVISGTGLVKQRRGTWPGIELPGTHPFSGTLYVGTGADYGSVNYLTAMPNVRKVVNQGSFIHNAPDGEVVTDAADIYSQFYGNDINFHTWGSGVVRMSGVYSWSDNGSDTDPALSDPARNFATVPHRDNKRGINIEGATVTWGDGTGNRFFLPGNENTVYINLHADPGGARSVLTFDYNGPVTLAAPISGGRYHDTMADVGRGDVVIAATRGNAVTFTAPQNYDGDTTIGDGASLRLGDGSPQGDSALLPTGKIVDNGELIVQNAAKGAELGRIGGTGSVTQAGPATTTLAGELTYTGRTTVKAGTLEVTGGSLAASAAVDLPSAGTKLDLTRAGDPTVTNLSGAEGSTVAGGRALTIRATTATTFGGALNATGDVTKTGAETLTLTGKHTTPDSAWTVRDGTLALAGSVQARQLAVAPTGALRSTGTVQAAVDNAGTVDAAGLTVRGAYTQRPGARLTGTRLTVTGAVQLAGTFAPNSVPGPGVIVDNQGTEPVAGTFDGLPEGAAVGAFRLTYHGGDGNDVVLTGGSGAARSGATTPQVASASRSGALWWLWAAGVPVLLAAAVVFLVRRRSRTRN